MHPILRCALFTWVLGVFGFCVVPPLLIATPCWANDKLPPQWVRLVALDPVLAQWGEVTGKGEALSGSTLTLIEYPMSEELRDLRVTLETKEPVQSLKGCYELSITDDKGPAWQTWCFRNESTVVVAHEVGEKRVPRSFRVAQLKKAFSVPSAGVSK